MSEVLFWVLIGIILALSFEHVLTYIFINYLLSYLKRVIAPTPLNKDKDEDSAVEGKNPDGTQKIKDEVLQGAFPIRDVKLVMVVREDLKMGKGKVGAQCGHATLAAYEQASAYAKYSDYWRKVLSSWSWEGQKKVCLKVMSE